MAKSICAKKFVSIRDFKSTAEISNWSGEFTVSLDIEADYADSIDFNDSTIVRDLAEHLYCLADKLEELQKEKKK